MSEKRKYDSSVARIAGNIASGMVANGKEFDPVVLAMHAVEAARAIVAEVERTEPAAPAGGREGAE